jgi:hypothetical protein
MRRERDPTPEEFEKLLAWLDPDRDQAGCKFQTIHSRLIKIFASRGCVDAATLADEVVNRVAVRIDTVKKNYPDPLRCCLGFVENVYREYIKEQQKIDNQIQPDSSRDPDELEKEDQCLTECLETLTQPDRKFFIRYFQGEGRARIDARKKLAKELRITANALRIKAHHLRMQMHQCMVTCLSQS